jgi:hemolysin activation/secretion protein
VVGEVTGNIRPLGRTEGAVCSVWVGAWRAVQSSARDGRRAVKRFQTRPVLLRWLVLGLAGLAMAIPTVAGAAAPPPPTPDPARERALQQGQIDPEPRPGRPDVEERPPAQIEKPDPTKRPAREAEGPKVFVRKFRVTGNAVVKTEKLEALVRADEGKELTLEQMRAAAARITDYYTELGYILARAFLPPQDVREGVIEIAVLEGNVGALEVTGNERYRSDIITRALTRFKNREVVHEGLLETAINDLNEYPGLGVRASLRPSTERGKSDILLIAQEKLPVTATLDANNYGSRFTGPWKYGFELGYGNLTGFGDKITLRGLKSDDDLWFARMQYLTPINGYGTKLGLSYSTSENGIGEEFAALNASGRQESWSVEFVQPFSKTAAVNFQAFGRFESIRSRQTVLNASGGVDDLRVFRFGFSGDYRDRFLGRSFYGLTWHQGVSWLGASPQDDPGNSRRDGPGGFSKLSVDLARLQSLVYGGSYLILRGFGQLSNQNLLTVEKFAIGGYYAVRGYPIAAQTGDHGYAVSAEVHVPVPGLRDWVRLVGFIDHGGAFLVSRDKGRGEIEHWMTGAGGGIRIDLPIPTPILRGALQIRVDYAVNVGGPKPSSHKNGITQGEPGILYFSVSSKF